MMGHMVDVRILDVRATNPLAGTLMEQAIANVSASAEDSWAPILSRLIELIAAFRHMGSSATIYGILRESPPYELVLAKSRNASIRVWVDWPDGPLRDNLPQPLHYRMQISRNGSQITKDVRTGDPVERCVEFALLLALSTNATEAMTAPRRRWFQFSLRTLFVAVTLAAVVIAGTTWYLDRPDFDVMGNVSRSDIAEIRELVRRSPELQGQTIVWLYSEPGGTAQVGSRGVAHVGQHQYGYRATTTLKKMSGAWSLVEIDEWIE